MIGLFGRRLRRRMSGLGLAIVLGAAGCGSDPGPGPADEVPAGAEIVIGASLELSGPGAQIGLVEQRALQIAIEKINENGFQVGGARHRLRLVIRDNLGRPPDARDAARQLVRVDKAVALVGGITVETSIAMAAVAEEEKVPLFSFAASDRVTQPIEQRRFVFTVAPKSADVADRIIRHVESLDLDGRVTLFAASDPHGEAGVPAMLKAAAEGGVKLEEPVRFAVSGRDINERAAEVVAGKPKVVVVWATLPGAGEVATALRRAGHEGEIIFDSGAGGSTAFPSRFHTAVEGAYMIHPIALAGGDLAANSARDLERQEFYSRYTRRHGTFSGYAPYGADTVGLVVEAMRRTGTVSGPALRDALEGDLYLGIAGGYDYSPTSHNGLMGDALGLFEVRRGDWARLS